MKLDVALLASGVLLLAGCSTAGTTSVEPPTSAPSSTASSQSSPASAATTAAPTPSQAASADPQSILDDLEKAGPPSGLVEAAKSINDCNLAWPLPNPDGLAKRKVNVPDELEANGGVQWVCSMDNEAEDWSSDGSRGPHDTLYEMGYWQALDPKVVEQTQRQAVLDDQEANGLLYIVGDDWVIVNRWPTKEAVPVMRAVQKAVGGRLVAKGIKDTDKEWGFYGTKARQPKPAKPSVNWMEAATGLDYRWLKSGQYSCSSGTSCNGMMVKATEDCLDGVYVAVNFLDASGNVVDWSNDTVPALESGRTAKLVFETYEKGVKRAELAEATCHVR